MKLTLITLAVITIVSPTLWEWSTRADSDTGAIRVGGLVHDHSLDTEVILFRRGPVNTRLRQDLDSADSDSARLERLESVQGEPHTNIRIVQLHDHVRPWWVRRLKDLGCRPIGYLPNNAYVIAGDSAAIARVARLDGRLSADDQHPIGWMGRFVPEWKIDPVLDSASLNSDSTPMGVEIELYDTPETAQAIHRIEELADATVSRRRVSHDFVVVSAWIEPSRLIAIAGEELVLFIGPSSEPRLLDERSDQIVASNLTADRTQPSGLGYLDWLTARQLNTPPDFSIDFSDTGIDRGSLLPKSLHPDFLDLAGNSRVSYINDYVGDGQLEDRRGHGTLVASIAAGNKNGGITDDQGYFLGLGVDPDALIGVSRIFGHDGKLPVRLDFGLVFSNAYASGARISNNSWG